jgi:aminoglycoside phosphotransferase (APT) family kinase protein
MARSHLTLAALATSAVAGLEVVAAARMGAADDFDAALLTGNDGRHWIARAPRNTRAEAEQSADLVALRALSAGVRSRLPFAVSSFAGQAPIGSTRVIVSEFVYGEKVPLGSFAAGPGGHADSVGRAVAAIHALPSSFVADSGLPALTAGECQRACISIMDRAGATGLVPPALLSRWERGVDSAELWQFQPTVVNGALAASSFLFRDAQVSGVLGWHGLRVADPAQDLQWMLGAHGEGVADSAFDAYRQVLGAGDRNLRRRATLYFEFELAKWLLHGTEVRSTEIVDDAVELLTSLAEGLRSDIMNPLTPQTIPTMAVDEVEALLARSERAV